MVLKKVVNTHDLFCIFASKNVQFVLKKCTIRFFDYTW